MIIDKAKAIELLERAVAEKGADYVDPQAKNVCAYVNDDGVTPSCIIGHAYFYAGATIAQLDEMDRQGSIEGIVEHAGGEGVLPVETTPEAIAAFMAAQDRQDAGNTWGCALQAAKAVAV